MHIFSPVQRSTTSETENKRENKIVEIRVVLKNNILHISVT